MAFDDLFDRLELEPGREGRGEFARLFPALSENGREGRAASIFLACLTLVPEFADAVLSPLGRPIGKRSRVAALTEVEFPKSAKERPDGLIAVQTGSSFWTCLVEFKVGGTLEPRQVENYLRLAREKKIDAVLTISNDIAPRADVPPIRVDGKLTRTVNLYHTSWMQLLSYLQLLVANDSIADRDHHVIAREFIRFLSHKSTGVRGYTQMPTDWSDVVDAVRDDKALRVTGDREAEIVNGWMQEERELAFLLSQRTGTGAHVVRRRAEKSDPSQIAKGHLANLVEAGCLKCSLSAEGVTAPIDIEWNLRTRTVWFAMSVKPPQDKSQAKACVTWLLKQLTEAEADAVEVAAAWPGRRLPTHATIAALRTDPYAIIEDRSVGLPTEFRLAWKLELQRGFSSRKGVITSTEQGLRDYYGKVGQHVQSWTSAPPKARERSPADEIIEESIVAIT